MLGSEWWERSCQSDDGNDGAGVFGSLYIAFSVGGDCDTCVVQDQSCIDEGVFGGPEAFGTVRPDGMKLRSGRLEGAFGCVVGLGTWEEENAGEGDGACERWMVKGYGCLLDKETPGFDALGRFDHEAVADVTF